MQCHGGVHQRNGLDLRTLPTVLQGGQSGPVVVPGKPEESLLWKKVSADEMPKTDNKVSAANKAIIQAWIAEARADIDAARLMTLRAAWTIEKHGFQAARDQVSTIKFYVSDVMMLARNPPTNSRSSVMATTRTIVPTEVDERSIVTTTGLSSSTCR